MKNSKLNTILLLLGVLISLHIADFISADGFSQTQTTDSSTKPTLSMLHATFPLIKARTLAKRTILFPRDLEGEKVLIVMVFEDKGRYQKAQSEALQWQALWEGELHNSIDFYEIPMMSAKYRWIRWWADAGMRSGIPKGKWDHIACFYGDKFNYVNKLNVADLSEAQIFLLGTQGEILFRESGPLTNEKENLLKSLLK